MSARIFVWLGLWLLGAAAHAGVAADSLPQLLRQAQSQPLLARILAAPARFELQVRWTRVLQTGQGWTLRSQHAGVDAGRWFAAASQVKLPMAIMALEQLAELDLPLQTHIESLPPDGCVAVPARADVPPQAESLQRGLRRLLLVSDNEAFNRIYQWLGPPLPQQRFRAMGFANAHITRPLMVCDDASRARLGSWTLRSSAAAPALLQGEARAALDRPLFAGAPVLRGRAWMENGVRMAGPHDFSDSNYLPLALLERELMSVVRPELLDASQRSSMREADRLWMRQLLGATPALSDDPLYPAADYPPYYAKFLLVGDGRAWPQGVRIYNKVGQSYGYLSDVAYIEDTRNRFGFFLSAVVFVDLDGTLNDGAYAYQELGLPFLAELGALILHKERQLRGVAGAGRREDSSRPRVQLSDLHTVDQIASSSLSCRPSWPESGASSASLNSSCL